MVGDRLPEIVDVVRLSSDPDIVVDFPHQSRALLIFDQWLNGQSPSGER